MRAAQDRDGMSGNVSLRTGAISMALKFDAYLEGLLTITRNPSHSAVLRAWSFAWGRPGSTVRIRMNLGARPIGGSANY